MSFESFPEEEVTYYGEYVFIHHVPYDGSYRVYFNVGVQYFQVGLDHDEREAADFTAMMLVKALTNLLLRYGVEQP